MAFSRDPGKNMEKKLETTEDNPGSKLSTTRQTLRNLYKARGGHPVRGFLNVNDSDLLKALEVPTIIGGEARGTQMNSEKRELKIIHGHTAYQGQGTSSGNTANPTGKFEIEKPKPFTKKTGAGVETLTQRLKNLSLRSKDAEKKLAPDLKQNSKEESSKTNCRSAKSATTKFGGGITPRKFTVPGQPPPIAYTRGPKEYFRSVPRYRNEKTLIEQAEQLPYAAVRDRSKPNPLVRIKWICYGKWYDVKIPRGGPNLTSRCGGYKRAFKFGQAERDGPVRTQTSIVFRDRVRPYTLRAEFAAEKYEGKQIYY